MDLYYIISSDIYNIIVGYLDHRDVMTIYDMTKHLNLFDRNDYLTSVFRCVEIAKASDISYYDHAILLNIALLKGEMGCIDYVFCKAKNEGDLILDGGLLRETINYLKMEPINTDIPVDICTKYSEYYASKIQTMIGICQTDILCVDMAVNGFYKTYVVLCTAFDRKGVFSGPKLITNVISKMDPIAMRMIRMDKFLESRPLRYFDINRSINALVSLTRYPGSISWFNWIENVIGIYPIVNESVFVFLQGAIIRNWTQMDITIIRDIQTLADSFRRYNIYDDMDDFIDADYPLDGLFHRIDLNVLYALETETNIKKDINLKSFFSMEIDIDSNLIKYLDKNYNLEFRYVKVPNMSTMEKNIIMKRLTYLSRTSGKSGPMLRYIILRLLIFAHKKNVDYIYLDSIISNIGTNNDITLYMINTIVYQQEIITLGYHKGCCPAIGLKYHRQVTFRLDKD